MPHSFFRLHSARILDGLQTDIFVVFIPWQYPCTAVLSRSSCLLSNQTYTGWVGATGQMHLCTEPLTSAQEKDTEKEKNEGYWMTSETTAEPESVLSLPYILSSKGEEFPSSEPQRAAPVCSLNPHVTLESLPQCFLPQSTENVREANTLHIWCVKRLDTKESS